MITIQSSNSHLGSRNMLQYKTAASMTTTPQNKPARVGSSHSVGRTIHFRRGKPVNVISVVVTSLRHGPLVPRASVRPLGRPIKRKRPLRVRAAYTSHVPLMRIFEATSGTYTVALE